MAQRMQFEPGFFADQLTDPAVVGLQREAAQKSLSRAQADAPVDSGDYKAGLGVEEVRLRDRVAVRVVGNDGKTMFVESKTGNLARSLNAARG
jgi:hypothetical protein